MSARSTAALLGVVALLSGACRQDMHDQAKYEPLEASTFFADGAASRTPVEGTVARGQLREDDLFYAGKTPDGTLTAEVPMEITRAVLERGRGRYDAFCSPCHGRLGDGRGMIVRRGFKQPTSFHDQRLREAAAGYYFDVITNGFGQMSPYRAQIAPEDRWAVVAYVRALQLSQRADTALLSDAERARLDEPTPETAAGAPGEGPGEGHGEGHG